MDIKAFYRKYCGVGDEALLSDLVKFTRIRAVEAGSTILEPGTQLNQMLLLGSGVVRSYFWGGNERIYTDGFYSAPGTLLSICRCMPEPECGIEALSACEILDISAGDVAELMSRSLPFVQMYARLLERMTLHQWQEKTACFQYSHQERYIRFLRQYPNWKGLISSKYIADYVGVAPESLSRLRRRLKSGNKG